MLKKSNLTNPQRPVVNPVISDRRRRPLTGFKVTTVLFCFRLTYISCFQKKKINCRVTRGLSKRNPAKAYIRIIQEIEKTRKEEK